MKITLIVLFISALLVILVTGFWDLVSTTIYPNTTWGLYNRDFFENLLVEMHGSIFDLIVVGVILYWFQLKKEERGRLNRAKEDLESLKFYYGKDSSFRFYSALRHLLSLGPKKVEIPEADFNHLKIDDLHLSDSNLIATNFYKSILSGVKLEFCDLEAANFIDSEIKKSTFIKTNLKRARFINAKLNGMNFKECDIRGANFKNAELKSANFRGVDCSQVNFKGANLRSSNFLGALNLTPEMILEAGNYKDTKLPFDI